MQVQASHQCNHRLSAEGPGVCGSMASLLRETGRDPAGTITLLGAGRDPCTQPRGIAPVLQATHRARRHPRRGPASDPFNRDLEALTGPFRSDQHPRTALPDTLFPRRHRCRRGMPQIGTVVRSLLDGLSLGTRQPPGLRGQQAVVLLLQLLLGAQLAFPLLGQLPGDQALRRLDEAVVAGSPLALVGRACQARLPQLV